eukprot:1195667-Prorocentrum_minimum.AAC.16
MDHAKLRWARVVGSSSAARHGIRELHARLLRRREQYGACRGPKQQPAQAKGAPLPVYVYVCPLI